LHTPLADVAWGPKPVRTHLVFRARPVARETVLHSTPTPRPRPAPAPPTSHLPWTSLSSSRAVAEKESALRNCRAEFIVRKRSSCQPGCLTRAFRLKWPHRRASAAQQERAVHRVRFIPRRSECRRTGPARKARGMLSFCVHSNHFSDHLNGASCTAFFRSRQLDPKRTCLHCCYFKAPCSDPSRVPSPNARSNVCEIEGSTARTASCCIVHLVFHVTGASGTQGESSLVFSQGGSPQGTVDCVPARVWHEALLQQFPTLPYSGIFRALLLLTGSRRLCAPSSSALKNKAHPRHYQAEGRKQAQHERLSSVCLNADVFRTTLENLA